MDSDNILRLALMLSNNQATTFKANLLKIVKLVLVLNYGTGLTAQGISSEIEKEYSLTFTDNEIVSSLRGDKEIITIEDSGNYKYTLKPEHYQRYKVKSESDIKGLINLFLKEVKSSFSATECESIILRFLYDTFNSDVQTVLRLIKKDDSEQDYCTAEKFSPEEAALINSFLNWNNKEKNELVLNLLSSCYDYCMLTIKKDDRSYSSVFNGKVFYLDTNIIFRLVGFDNKERQSVMKAFIDKCQKAGIKICYTNFTNNEIRSTVTAHVNSLKKLLGDQSPIKPSFIKTMDSKYSNLDFYEKYFEWTKSLHNTAGDFNAFQKFLIREIENCINKFKMEVVETFDNSKNHNDFKDKCEDFDKYKSEHYRTTNEKAISADINNYYYMMQKDNNGQAGSFLELKYFFITADRCLTEWADAKRPGATPIFILPSIWYSILLKYKGRTENDYEAFCKFINIRIAPEEDKQLDMKRVMLAYVLNLDEPQKIKEMIIQDISEQLNDSNVIVDDPGEFVEKIHGKITDEFVKEAVSEERKKHTNELNLYVSQSEKSNAENYDKGKSDGYSLGEKEGKESGKEELLEKQANDKADFNKNICIGFNAVIIFLFVAALVILTYKLVMGDIDNASKFVKWYNANTVAIGIITGICSLLLASIKCLLKKVCILSYDSEKIKEQLMKKYSDKKIK